MRLKVASRTRHHPANYCIMSWWLMLSPPYGPSATNHMNCLLVALRRLHRNCYCIVRNTFCLIGTFEILITIDIVHDVVTSLDTPSNAILQLPFRHCTRLGQVIKGVDFSSLVVHYLLDRGSGQRHFIVVMMLCRVCIQLSLLKQLLSCYHSQNLEGSPMRIGFLVCLFKIHHRSFWEFSSCIYEVAKLADMVREVIQQMHLDNIENRFVHEMICIV